MIRAGWHNKNEIFCNALGGKSELLEFLSIPSISSLPEHASDVQQTAHRVADRLTTAGLENVQILPTEGHPVVYGAWLLGSVKPTVLIYDHVDTQPVDPLDLWTHPPFELVIIPADHWGNQAAAEVLEELYGKTPYDARVGGSIPVCELFLTHPGASTVGFAFGLSDEQIHSPNEFYHLASFRRGPVAYCKIRHRLAEKEVTPCRVL